MGSQDRLDDCGLCLKAKQEMGDEMSIKLRPSVEVENMFLASLESLDRTRRVGLDTFCGVEWQEDLLSEYGICRRACLKR
jgi:hypothetical protein